MAAHQQHRLENLAEELTRALGIPFVATEIGTIAFRDRLRVTDWAVPLMFDGHVRRSDDALIPADFVGHLLWPALTSTRGTRYQRAWWSCTLNWRTAEALAEALRDEDEPVENEDGWVIGRDVLLDDVFAGAGATSSRRVA
jgi:hypothetical protein